MDEISPTILSVFSILGGATLTVVAGFFGAWLQGRREHHRWLRAKRLEAYGAFLSTIDYHRGLSLEPNALTLEGKAAFLRESNDAAAAISLLGPEPVVDAFNLFIDAANEDSNHSSMISRLQDARLDTRADFVNAARKAVGIKGKTKQFRRPGNTNEAAE